VLACNHPALVAKDFMSDPDALENNMSSKDNSDDEGLANALTALTVSGASKCAVCQIEYGNIFDAETIHS